MVIAKAPLKNQAKKLTQKLVRRARLRSARMHPDVRIGCSVSRGAAAERLPTMGFARLPVAWRCASAD